MVTGEILFPFAETLFLNKIYEAYIACNQTMLLEDHNLKDEI